MDTNRRKVVKVNNTSRLGLPEDVLAEILLKLPVKSLLRFRCVSKDWCALTKSSYFISKHLVHPSRCSDPHHPCLFLLSCTLKPTPFSLLRDEEITPLRIPFLTNLTIQRSGFWLVRSSNGLVCCSLILRIENHHHNTTGVHQLSIVVWNPATEQYRFLPKPNNSNIPLDQDEAEDIVREIDNRVPIPLIGFDFIHAHDITEYKLVRVFCHIIDDPNDRGRALATFRALVFVRSTDSWRPVKNELGFPSCKYSSNATAITLNRVLYWKVQRAGDGCFVLSFNLREEVFNVIELPMDVQNQDDLDGIQLFSWRNSLAAIAFDDSYNSDDLDSIVWVMMSTDQESNPLNPVWTPQVRLKYSVLPENVHILGIWKDQFLLVSEESDEDFIVPNELFSYDPKSHTKRKLLKNGERIEVCLCYVETLVPV